VDPAIAQIPLGHLLLVDVLRVWGSTDLQARLFADVLAGARIGNALAERGGLHARDLKTRLVRTADCGLRPAGAQALLHGHADVAVDRGERPRRR
jgi:hypothetical protein